MFTQALAHALAIARRAVFVERCRPTTDAARRRRAGSGCRPSAARSRWRAVGARSAATTGPRRAPEGHRSTGAAAAGWPRSITTVPAHGTSSSPCVRSWPSAGSSSGWRRWWGRERSCGSPAVDHVAIRGWSRAIACGAGEAGRGCARRLAWSCPPWDYLGSAIGQRGKSLLGEH